MRALLLMICLVVFGNLKAHTLPSLIDKSEPEVTHTARTDGQFVYVTLTTADEDIIKSMLGRGFSVYFDVKGKKKKNVGVSSPVLEHEGGKGRQEGQSRPSQATGDGRRELRLQPMLDKLPHQAIYTNYDTRRVFHLDLNNLNIALGYTVETIEGTDILTYELKIPIARISEKKIDFNKMTVGVVSTKKEEDNRSERGGVSFGNQGGGGGRQGGGGGPPGGGQGGQGGGGARQGGGQRPTQQGPTMESLNLWFQLDQA